MRVALEPLRPGVLARLLASIWVRLGRVNEQRYKESGWDSYAEKLQFRVLQLRFCLATRGRKEQLQRMADDLRSSRISARYRDKINVYCQKLEACLRRTPTGEVTFKHSGNAGDIIYAVPAIKALCRGLPAKLFLKLDAPINDWSEKEHPLGKSGLNFEMVKLLRPLLEHQPWLSSVQIHDDKEVDYDLDLFREMPDFQVGRGHIAHWYFWVFGVSADLSQPWLEIRPTPAPGNKIVLARSARYRNPNLDYTFLRHLPEIDFVGTPSEFQEMQQVLPQLRHAECADFLQLARIIKSARLFIGNQSFPYALAEALKVPRILEVYPPCPNVIPTGGRAGEAHFQPNFEKLVKMFLEQARHKIPDEPRASN